MQYLDVAKFALTQWSFSVLRYFVKYLCPARCLPFFIGHCDPLVCHHLQKGVKIVFLFLFLFVIKKVKSGRSVQWVVQQADDVK